MTTDILPNSGPGPGTPSQPTPPFPPPSPWGPRAKPVDPHALTFEIQLKLEIQGHEPGDAYNHGAAVDAVRDLLVALDIRSSEDTWENVRVVVAA